MLSGERLSCFTSSSSHVSSSGCSFHILRRCLVWKLNGSPSVLPFAAWLSNIPSGLAHSLLSPLALRSALSTNGSSVFVRPIPLICRCSFLGLGLVILHPHRPTRELAAYAGASYHSLLSQTRR